LSSNCSLVRTGSDKLTTPEQPKKEKLKTLDLTLIQDLIELEIFIKNLPDKEADFLLKHQRSGDIGHTDVSVLY